MAVLNAGLGEVMAAEPREVAGGERTGRQAQELGGDGLRITFGRVSGWTEAGLLKVPLTLQCPPLEAFQIQHAFTHQDYDTLRAGQFSRAGSRQLRTVQFQTVLVDFAPEWAVWRQPGGFRPPTGQGAPSLDGQVADRRLPNPLQVVDELRDMLDSGTPFSFTAAAPTYWGAKRRDLSMMATLRALSVEERAGEPDARYLDLQVTEFRRPALTRKREGRARHAGGGRVRDLPYKHLVRKGDTLAKLAKHYYGRQDRWRTIAQANGARGLSASGDLPEWARKHRAKYVSIPAVNDEGQATQVSTNPTKGTETFDPLA